MVRAIRADIQFFKGQRQANLGNWDSSIVYYDRALSLNPKDGGVYVHKALSLSEQRKYQDALSSMNQAIKLEPENHAYYLFQGIIQYDQGEYDNALTSFEKSLSLSPENNLLKCYIALALLRNGVKEKAAYEALSSNIQNTNPGCKARFLVLCEEFLLKNNEISLSFRESEFYNSNLKAAKQSSGFLDSVFQKLNLALINLSGLFNSDKKNYNKHHFFAKQKFQNNDISGSIKEYKSALSYMYDFNEAFEELLNIYFYQKDYRSILECISKLEDYNKVSNWLTNRKRSDAEKDGIPEGLNNCAALLIAMGLYNYHTGDYKKAIDIFSIVVSNFSDGYYYNYYLGLSYLGSGDSKNAFTYFQKTFQKLNPDLAMQRLEEMIRVSESASTI